MQKLPGLDSRHCWKFSENFLPNIKIRYSSPSLFLPFRWDLLEEISNASCVSSTRRRRRNGRYDRFLVPAMAKSFGAKGSLVNHSEHRLPENQIVRTVTKLAELEMTSIVCARDDREVETFSRLSPDFVAIEPPELIGSGIAVSKARPELIQNSKTALEQSKPRGSATKLICGAGIVEEIDAKLAVELGAEGSSSRAA